MFYSWAVGKQASHANSIKASLILRFLRAVRAIKGPNFSDLV